MAGCLSFQTMRRVGEDIRRYLNLDDTLFTLKLTPNLAHCLSVFGIAREVSALTGSALTTPVIKPSELMHGDRLPVPISARPLRAVFRSDHPERECQGQDPFLDGRTLGPLRPTSVAPLVDISNYVMFELGSPLISSISTPSWGTDVRWGQIWRALKLLNGNTVEVDSCGRDRR